jgi:membrane protein DedA with SNARE-associated domain
LPLPFGFHDWLPAVQAGALGLLTFVQEDVPTVSAALLASAGRLPWIAGFLGVFLGIWVGDALLYLVARGVGRPLLERAWTRRFLDPATIARSEQWFAEKGTWLLLSSRFVPGTRLPTYLAAGFLHLPFRRFLLVTGIAVASWTIGIFTLARVLGPELLGWLQRWNAGGWTGVMLIAGLILAIRVATKLGQKRFRRRLRMACLRAMRWEFWPAWLFYSPVALNYLWLAARYRGFTLPTAANPGIFSGGFVGESKIGTLANLQAHHPDYTAEAHLLEGTGPIERVAKLEESLVRLGFDYPFILKPDVGQRGVGVKLIRSPAQAEAFLHQTDAPLILQRYAPGPHEAGIFYYRLPSEPRGRIMAITEKIFPTVIGDGRHTIEELIWGDERARLIADRYLQRLNSRRDEILPTGTVFKLVEAGNHAQGCIFQDGEHLWSEQLERRIDEISRQLDGFFVGRYDVRYGSVEDLRAGGPFQIVELNGAASEATNIYDARNTLWSAYRTLFRQWRIVFTIGAENRRRGCAPTELGLLWRKWRESAALAATYPVTD